MEGGVTININNDIIKLNITKNWNGGKKTKKRGEGREEKKNKKTIEVNLNVTIHWNLIGTDNKRENRRKEEKEKGKGRKERRKGKTRKTKEKPREKEVKITPIPISSMSLLSPFLRLVDVVLSYVACEVYREHGLVDGEQRDDADQLDVTAIIATPLVVVEVEVRRTSGGNIVVRPISTWSILIPVVVPCLVVVPKEGVAPHQGERVVQSKDGDVASVSSLRHDGIDGEAPQQHVLDGEVPNSYLCWWGILCESHEDPPREDENGVDGPQGVSTKLHQIVESGLEHAHE